MEGEEEEEEEEEEKEEEKEEEEYVEGAEGGGEYCFRTLNSCCILEAIFCDRGSL